MSRTLVEALLFGSFLNMQNLFLYHRKQVCRIPAIVIDHDQFEKIYVRLFLLILN